MQLLRRWAAAVFILTFLVVIAGGVVRTTQSGMGCPDWPKCFGKWIPPTNASELPPDFEKYLGKQDIDHTFNVYHTWIEYVNRLLGALLGLFAVIQFSLFFVKRTSYKKPFQLSFIFLALVILTGLFGALVVTFNLAHLSISVHLVFALAMIQVQLALLLSLKNNMHVIPVTHQQKKLLFAFLAVVLIQFTLGTMVRIYIDDVSKILHYEQREKWLAAYPLAFILHRSFSWLVLASVFYVAWKFYKTTNVKNKVLLLAAAVVLNAASGIILAYAGVPAAAQPVHLLLACLGITQIFHLLFITKAANG